MLSGQFENVPLSSISLNADRRQRKEVPEESVAELAASIAANGLMHPIVVHRESMDLIAGETRYLACNSLGWTHIPVQWAEECTEGELQLLQLEENLRRTDITWQEEALAIASYHDLRGEEEGWTMGHTATALNLSPQRAGQNYKIAIALRAGDEQILKCDSMSVARGILQRRNARAASVEISLDTAPQSSEAALAVSTTPVSDLVSESAPEAGTGGGLEREPLPFYLADFTTWQMDYAGPKFNLIHCDFPYGIDTNKHDSSAQGFINYDDGEDVYWNLIATLTRGMKNVVAEQAHMIFWYSKKFHVRTREALEGMGWEVHEYELVWAKSNRSILARPGQDYRRGTEQAFFCTRNGFPIVRPTVNFYHGPATKEIHKSEKPRDMLTHFMKPLVDESTYMLDPTMGSGNAVRVAKSLGAARYVGLEKLPEVYESSCIAYKGARNEEIH